MKAELVDVNETRKSLSIEIPSDLVDAEIERIARDYSRKARIPGFRPGKVPSRVVRQRYKDQILHDVAHEMVPRAVDAALREKGLEPVSSPDIREVVVEEGRSLTFTAAFDTLPPFELGDFSTIALTRKSTAVSDEALNDALQRLRERAARHDVIEDRGVVDGDVVTVDIDRTDATGASDLHKDVAIELGAKANPPGFDEQLLGLENGAVKSFSITFPADYPNGELANTTVSYTVTVKAIKRRNLPELDDEFAKDVGDFDSLAALRARVREDMQADGEAHAKQHTRGDLLKQLAGRVTFDLPTSLVEREMDRRLEEFVRQHMAQKIDPRTAGLDWQQFREAQREGARDAVASALVLDEIARRENITVAPEDVDKEIERFALRAGRTPAALRAQLEKEGGISRLYAGLRREKAVDLALSRAKMTDEAHHDTPAAD